MYGNVHDPASETTIRWFFTTTLHFKAWLTTVAVFLAILQLLGGLWMFGRLPFGHAPLWVGPAHRIAGSLALLVSLPVAYHCLWSLGFDPDPGGRGGSGTPCSAVCSTGRSPPRCSSCARTGCRAGRCRSSAACCSRFSC